MSTTKTRKRKKTARKVPHVVYSDPQPSVRKLTARLPVRRAKTDPKKEDKTVPKSMTFEMVQPANAVPEVVALPQDLVRPQQTDNPLSAELLSPIASQPDSEKTETIAVVSVERVCLGHDGLPVEAVRLGWLDRLIRWAAGE